MNVHAPTSSTDIGIIAICIKFCIVHRCCQDVTVRNCVVHGVSEYETPFPFITGGLRIGQSQLRFSDS